MSDDNPVTIDLAPSGKFRIGLGGYSIDVPTTPAGVKYIVQILQARHDTADTRIARPPSPTQAMCEAFLKEEARRAKQAAAIPYIEVDL
jgi:hypothetical protein